MTGYPTDIKSRQHHTLRSSLWLIAAVLLSTFMFVLCALLVLILWLIDGAVWIWRMLVS